MVIKNLENKIRLTGIVCTAFLVGCVIISVSSIWDRPDNGRGRAQESLCAGRNVPILVSQTTMDERSDVEAKSHVEMFHHYFFTLAPETSTSVTRWRRPCTWWTRPDWHNIIRSKRKVSTATFSERARVLPSSATASIRCSQNGVHLLRTAAHRTSEQHPDARTGSQPDSSNGCRARRTTRTGCSS